MSLHIGGNKVIMSEDLVAILAYDLNSKSSAMEKYIQKEKDNGRVIELEEGETKSVIIMKDRIYTSRRTVDTLRKRLESY